MKRVISFILVAFMLIGAMPVFASAAEFDAYNFDTIELDVQGYSETQGFMIGVSSLSSLGLTADDHEKLVGCFLNGTVTKDGATVTIANAPIISTIKSDEAIIRIWIGEQNITNGWFDNTGYTANITLSPAVDLENFKPITLDVQGYSETQGFMIGVSSLSVLGLTADDHEKLVGCLLNGTVTKEGTTITLINAPIISTIKSDASIIRLWVGAQNITNGWFSSTGYTANITLSPAVDFENFNPVTLDVQGYSETQGFMIGVSSLSSLGLTADDHEKLVGCLLNGTVTKEGTTITLINAPIISTIKSDASIIRLWVGAQNITNGWFSSTGYTANITLSPAPKENETDFEPVKINVSAVGSDGAGHKRFVIQNNFTFPITAENQLKGCVLNGTVTYNGSDEGISKSVPFVNVPVVAQPMRTDGGISLDFTVPSGYAIKESSVSEYVFDLTISPAIDISNFTPFKISIERTGTPDELVTKRLLITNTMGIDPTVEDQLKGWYLNGTATYSGTGEYSKTVIFSNVPVVAQPAKTDGTIAIDFKVPAGYTLRLQGDEDANYVWDLTLSINKSGDIDIKNAEVSGNSALITLDNNMLVSSMGLKLIVAVYDADSMVEAKIVSLPDIAPGASMNMDAVSFASTDWTFGKVFVWSDAAGIIPFADVAGLSK